MLEDIYGRSLAIDRKAPICNYESSSTTMGLPLDVFSNMNLSKAHAYDGWALQKAVSIDIGGSRGFAADITTCGILKRQAAFCILATVDLDNPGSFLSRLGAGQSGVGDVIRGHLAKNLVSAAFGRPVPGGYLRALVRIGSRPLEKPHLYRRLF